jgi:hypothetical protein
MVFCFPFTSIVHLFFSEISLVFYYQSELSFYFIYLAVYHLGPFCFQALSDDDCIPLTCSLFSDGGEPYPEGVEQPPPEQHVLDDKSEANTGASSHRTEDPDSPNQHGLLNDGEHFQLPIQGWQ